MLPPASIFASTRYVLPWDLYTVWFNISVGIPFLFWAFSGAGGLQWHPGSFSLRHLQKQRQAGRAGAPGAAAALGARDPGVGCGKPTQGAQWGLSHCVVFLPTAKMDRSGTRLHKGC